MLAWKGRSKKLTYQINKSNKLVTKNEEKPEVLNKFFTSVFNGNLTYHTSQVDGQQDGDWGNKSKF